VPVVPDTNVYAVALLLTVASGFIFGAVPVRQVLRMDPYPTVKSGSPGTVGRRMSVRDLLLVVQIAICGVLVTSSIVAVRGLLRSLNTSLGFQPQNVMLVDTELTMAGYTADKVPDMQKRMIEAVQTVPGVASVGLIDQAPLWGGRNSTLVFTDQTSDLRPSNAAGQSIFYDVSPEYFHAAGTALLSGRSITSHDDKEAPRVAVINQQFARTIFGSVKSAVGGYCKLQDGKRIQVVGVVEDGKYASITEDPQPAMFLPFQQSPSSSTWLVVRSERDSQQLAGDLRTVLRRLEGELPLNLQTWNNELETGPALFGTRMATVSLGVLGVMGAMLSVTGIFGMAAYSVSKRMRELGIRMALGAQARQVLYAALGRALKLLALGSVAGLLLGILASRVLSFIVYQATPRDPWVLTGVVLTMLLLGLLATWIPAQRALSIDPMRLLREE
jgi:predicted permease